MITEQTNALVKFIQNEFSVEAFHAYMAYDEVVEFAVDTLIYDFVGFDWRKQPETDVMKGAQ